MRSQLIWIATILLIAACRSTPTPPDSSPPSKTIDSATPRKKDPSHLRIAFGSCIKNPNTPMWGRIADHRPDILLLLGDTIYQERGDLGEPVAIRSLYQNLFDQPGFASLSRDTRIMGTWDDHDFGPNNSDASYKGRAISLSIYREFFPLLFPVAGLESGTAQDVTIDGVRIILLDDRSYRHQADPTKQGTGTMFGAVQLQFLLDALHDPKAAVLVLASGNQWLATGAQSIKGVELLAQYPQEFSAIKTAIESSPAEVVLLSGDRHLGEILEYTHAKGRTIEITSSPLSAPVATSNFFGEEPLRRSQVIVEQNFGMVTIDTAGVAPVVVAELYGEHGGALASIRIPQPDEYPTKKQRTQ